MASHFVLELDTTPPMLEISTPRYISLASNNNKTTITSDEDLMEYQWVSVVDSDNNSFNFTLTRESDREYSGILDLSGASMGTAVIYASLLDEVGNSGIVFDTFDIIKSSILLKLKTAKEYAMDIKGSSETIVNIEGRINS